MDAIDRLNAKLDGMVILKAIEVDILEDGSLDLPDDVLKDLDFTVCSVHSTFKLSRRKQTERMIRAMDNPYCTILGHPTGRLIQKREPYDVDMECLMEAAREHGCFLELNVVGLQMSCYPWRGVWLLKDSQNEIERSHCETRARG